MPSKQTALLKQMERDFQITRKLFLNLKTGWFDNSKKGSNLVYAKDISIPHIQGRYRLNLNDNKLRIQEFFFDLEWSSFTEDGKKIELITKDIVDSYFPMLKKAAKKLLFILLKYIPKEYVYIRVSGSGLHIIFFLKGLQNMDEWDLITRYLIFKSKLQNTKNAENIVFGLDKDTILSSDRKIAEFGSWNKLKKDLKQEVDYLNYATYLTVDEFFKAKHYPFCLDLGSVKFPDRYQYFEIPKKLLDDTNNARIDEPVKSVKDLTPVKDLALVKDKLIIPCEDKIPKDEPAAKLKKCPAYWNMLRSRETEWYERHFLVKFLKYAMNLSKEQIIELIDQYHGWSDYNPRTTAYYVRKHFRYGTCETKVSKPPRKQTLIKYGLCKDNCEDCVYHTGQKTKGIVYAVVGSRGINDYGLLKKTLDALKISKIISGGAIGVDTLASKYTKEKNIPLIEFKPDYSKYGRKAPLVRNRKIVEESEAVIAFWDGASRGTNHTINYARKINKPLEIVYVKITEKQCTEKHQTF